MNSNGTIKVRQFWDLIKAATHEWWHDNSFRFAAALAFYTIFSLAPILVIATSIAGLVFGQEVAAQQIAKQVEQLIGIRGAIAVHEITTSARDVAGGPLAVTIGVITLLLGSTMVFAELQADLNQIWDVQPDPHPTTGLLHRMIRSRLQSFALVLGVGFLLLVSLVISAGLDGAHDYLDTHVRGMPWLWRSANFAVSLAVVTVLFGMIYRYLPDAQITWKDVAIGSLVTAVLFTAGKRLIGLYLGQLTIGSIYGAAGSFAVLLIWVYYSSLICFFGAEFTQVYARRYGSRIHPEEHAVRVGHKPNRI